MTMPQTIAKFLESQGAFNVKVQGRSVRFTSPNGHFDGTVTWHRGGAMTEEWDGEATFEHPNLASLKKAWRDGADCMTTLTKQALDIFYQQPANLGAVAFKLGVTQQALAKSLCDNGVSLFCYDSWSGHCFALKQDEESDNKRRQLQRKFGKDFPLLDPDYIDYQLSRGVAIVVPKARKATKADYAEAANPGKPTPAHISCRHDWNGPYKASTVRYCKKCGSKQTN